MEELITSVSELRYALDTFYLLISGVLVMWMAAGFAMLEAGLVRAKNTTEILTKNILLYAIACVMYLLVGYNIMYVDNGAGGWLPSFGSLMGSQAEDAGHSLHADFFFQVVFVATATSIISGAVAERMKLWSFLLFCVVMTGFIYPVEGYWSWGGGFLKEAGFSDFAGSGIVPWRVPRPPWPPCCCSAPVAVNMASKGRSTPSPAPTCRSRPWAP